MDIEFRFSLKFERDLKRLVKKFRTLEEDLYTFKKVLSVEPGENPPISVKIPGYQTENPKIIKVRRFACRALKRKGSNTGLRIIYAYHSDVKLIEFIEFYYKGYKEKEDGGRIRDYLKEFL